MSMSDIIRDKLTAAFAPIALDVKDESGLHAGHSGSRPGGETHFRVRIVSETFAGLGRVERQRRIYAELSAELQSQIHALTLVTETPEEAGSPEPR
jgi:BolA protein